MAPKPIVVGVDDSPESRRALTLAWKIAFASEVKEKLASDELLLAAGEAETVVSGACVSIVQLKVAGVESAFEAASRARTFTVCGPSTRLLNVKLAATAEYAAPSRLASKVEPVSVELAAKVALRELTSAAGVAVSEVSGGVVSTTGGGGVGDGVGEGLPPPPPPQAHINSAPLNANRIFFDDILLPGPVQ